MFRGFGRIRLLIALLAVLVGLAITGTAAAAFRPAGHARYAFASVDVSGPTTSTSNSFVDMAGMSVSVNVGGTQHANLFITFSGELNGCGPIWVRAIVDSTANVAAPGAALLLYPTGGGAEARGFTWSSTVASGAHTVTIQWQDQDACSQAFASVRSLFVTANVY